MLIRVEHRSSIVLGFARAERSVVGGVHQVLDYQTLVLSTQLVVAAKNDLLHGHYGVVKLSGVAALGWIR